LSYPCIFIFQSCRLTISTYPYRCNLAGDPRTRPRSTTIKAKGLYTTQAQDSSSTPPEFPAAPESRRRLKIKRIVTWICGSEKEDFPCVSLGEECGPLNRRAQSSSGHELRSPTRARKQELPRRAEERLHCQMPSHLVASIRNQFLSTLLH
jgi:hypothetical protein